MVGGLMRGCLLLLVLLVLLGTAPGCTSGQPASVAGTAPTQPGTPAVLSDTSWSLAYLATVDAGGQGASFTAALNVRQSGKGGPTHLVLTRRSGQSAAPLRYELPGEIVMPEGGPDTQVVPLFDLRVHARPVFLYVPIDPELLPPSLGIRWQSAPPAGSAIRAAVEVGPLPLPAIMPAGELTLAQRDASGHPQLVGQRSVDELAPGSHLEVAGPVVPTLIGRRSAELEVVDRDSHKASEHVILTVENRGDRAATVVILDALTRAQRWRIVEAATAVDKYDEHTVRMTITVPARGQRSVDYRVAYAW
jgi:hypothetical protein